VERFSIDLKFEVEVRRLADGGLHVWLVWPDGYRRLLLNLTPEGAAEFRGRGPVWITAFELKCGSSLRLAEALGPVIWRECGAAPPEA
jgi:hypothetical protein